MRVAVNPSFLDLARCPARANLVAAVLILLSMSASWLALRPTWIVSDWMGWRQADTQQMALNAARPDATFNIPRINWGGAEPAPVQAEFQLYQELVAVLLRWTISAESPGQLLSLIFVAVAAFGLYGWLLERFGAWPALLGLAAFLANRNVLFLATSVQPDALGLMSFVLALWSFDRWTRTRQTGLWWCWVVLTAVSGAIKPLNLQLGIAQFLWVAFAHRDVLRRPTLWAGWAAILLAVGVQLWHGAAIFRDSGLTFGILSGGDSKLPALSDLYRLGHYRALFKVTVQWGLQPIGLIALGLILLRSNPQPLEWALAIAYGVAMVVAMRYTSYAPFGSHYHATAAVLASHLVAHAVRQATIGIQATRWAVPLIGAVVLVQLAWNVSARLTLERDEDGQAYERAAKLLCAHVVPGDPVLVRSEAPGRVAGWQGGPNNFQDPRLFYLLGTTGWVVALDAFAVADIESFRDQGAVWYLEPTHTRASGEQQAWLGQHATLVVTDDLIRAWRLSPSHTPLATDRRTDARPGCRAREGTP